MITLEDNFKTKFKYGTCIALGSFDGLHLGHLQLINKAIQIAKKNKCKSMVCTFKNHPLTIINEDLAPKLIMNEETKIQILNKLGVDIVNFINFDYEFMKMCAEDFIKNLVECYSVKAIIVGFNFRFGYKNLGDVELLKELSKKFNFKVHIIKAVKSKEGVISSSKIRNILSEEGDIEKANKMLTRYFSLKGKVVKGKQIGREMGFPTINLDYDKKFVLPRGGVYFTIVEYKKMHFKGITNIGYNPTVNNDKLGVETHILNFNQNVYGENITIYFVKRIRDEKKFNSKAELSEQLKNDKLYAEKQRIELNI
ncbi:riboflavin biosynthesis protein RibF [Clostridium acetireducens DSM 10703]|uniref:Riboflavin biosynthesis protein n=1 Tax=Clostridium acetireducens DSM 10703 TaxID=1121290 RepID=A0A1E8F2X4_9CLOT|nr:bifunctional riboflavin kinase/FAD synthetase [Clostridium acetireducens]OFI07733.1 riboflavin biosynthesis protein RibF [Clostridium acetireducens DSM 10703]